MCEALCECHAVPDGAAVRDAYRRQDRDRLIAGAMARGEPSSTVAVRHGVSPSWVRRVARRELASAAPRGDNGREEGR